MAAEPQRALAPIHRMALQEDTAATQLAKRLAPKFPKDLNSQTAIEFARVALAYGLDPFMGEMLPYQGQPYITMAGRFRIADEHPAYDGMDIEPASDDERRALGAHDSQIVWKCTVYRKDRKRPAVAYGRAGGPTETNPTARQWCAELAQKRAQHRALRAAFPVPIPSLDERLSPAQLKAIHAYDNDLGVSDDERHAELQETFGVESSAELTSAQATSYIEARVIEKNPTIDAESAVVDGDEPEEDDNRVISQPDHRRLIAKAQKLAVPVRDLTAFVRSAMNVEETHELTVRQARVAWDWLSEESKRRKAELDEDMATLEDE